MFPLLAAGVTGAFGLAGSMFSSDTSAQNTQANIAMQRETNEFNANQAQVNRDFQQQMSSTAYQRASQDMQKAGLNPAMMFGSGSAASTPGGSVATGQAPRSERTSPFRDLGQIADRMVNSAVSAKTFEKMTEEIANIQSDTALTKAREGVETQRRATEVEETSRRGAEAKAAEYRLPAARFSARQAEGLNLMPQWLIDAGEIGSYGLGKAGQVGDVISSFLHSAKSVKGLRDTKRELPPSWTEESHTDRHEGGSSTWKKRDWKFMDE